MPKKTVYSKEFIIEKSFELFKQYGVDYITARNVAHYLNCSPIPIYSSIGSMEDLKEELIKLTKNLFIDYISKKRTGVKFLDIGMGICIFSREEKKIFSDIFLREKSEKNLFDEFTRLIHNEIEKDNRFSSFEKNKKEEMFIDCWIFAYGLSTLIATGYIENPSDEYIKQKLLNNPAKLLYRILEENK